MSCKWRGKLILRIFLIDQNKYSIINNKIKNVLTTAVSDRDKREQNKSVVNYNKPVVHPFGSLIFKLFLRAVK